MRRSFAVLTLVVASTFAPAGCSCGSDGNNKNPDGGVPDAPPDGPQTTEVVCEQLPANVSGATCEVSGSVAT